jgi:hypothetical protein
MKLRWLIPVILTTSCFGQAWSTFLDPSRAVSWNPGFSIPAYTVACATQPSLTTGSGNGAVNTTAINAALASCDATHNVVNLPAGTYYVNSINFGTQGKMVLRGAGSGTGSGATYLYILTTGGGGCDVSAGVCMGSSPVYYNGSSQVLPGGSNACSWTAGYAQGTTSITLSSCGSAPPLNQTIILDQANDPSDTGGVFTCDTNTGSAGEYVCTYKGYGAGNANGRVISGTTHSEQQVVYTTGVTSLGGGSYTVTISPGVYFTNIRTGQTPGAWWPGFSQSDGIENLTLDYSHSTAGATNYGAIVMQNCYDCWVKGIQSIDAGRDHVLIYQGAHDVVRDSYFYQSQAHSSVSYTVELEETSDNLIENNIMQQVTNPLMFEQGAGNVMGYNLSLDDIFTSGLQASYTSHDAANNMNLWEGNNLSGIWADDAWGSSNQITLFRNKLSGWQSGLTSATVPVIMRAWIRNINYIGNVLGQPSYHNIYQVYATSATGGVNLGSENTAIYSIGTADSGGLCSSGHPTCDALGFTTTMRWGNWDVVNNATQWNTTEAATAANTYVNANFTTSYFSTLAQTLPSSLYYNSTPSWWPSGKPWPTTGPDITMGNLGECSGGTYAGAMATSSSQCTGGTLATAWGSHVTSIPAQDCYLNVMGGPPDGSGSVLNFSASTCYTGAASYTLAVSTAGTGTGTLSGTNCSSATYPTGTNITCTETASSGSFFVGWSGGSCSNAGPCSFSLSSNSTVIATFNLLGPAVTGAPVLSTTSP